MRVYEIIAERLWISPRTHDLTFESCLKLLRSRQISVIVNVWSRRDECAVPLVDQYFHLPLRDGLLTEESLSQFRCAAGIVTTKLREGRRVLVHCRGGRNRAALVAALVLMERGRTGLQALHDVLAVRPRAFENQHFYRWLEVA